MVPTGAKGSSAQRNTILDVLADADVVVFFDDDFFPVCDYLEQVERLFSDHPDVVAATGRPIEDGVKGPGLSVEHGLRLVSEAPRAVPTATTLTDTFGTYGCNMAFRLSVVREHAFRFDENLPLYGWQEDIDFSSRMAPYGRVVSSSALRGVHLGNKPGRTSGLRFGYSQVANPIYLVRKGTMPPSYASSLVFKNIVANLLRSVWPEPWIDRRGRLAGNALAVADTIMGRVSPRRILQLK
jgi:GT2 family glycosyltransferase